MTSQPTPSEPIYDGLIGEQGDVVAAARHAAEQLPNQPDGSLGMQAENVGAAAQHPDVGATGPRPLSEAVQPHELGPVGSAADGPADPFDGSAGH